MSGSDQIWAEALRTLERGQPFALATVVNVRGSTPREVGAKMIVRADGQFGTIGGGCGEAEVFRKARVLLEEKNDSRRAPGRGRSHRRFRPAGNRHLRRNNGRVRRSVVAGPRPRNRAQAGRRRRPQRSRRAADGGRFRCASGNAGRVAELYRSRRYGRARRGTDRSADARRSRRSSSGRPTRFPPCSKLTAPGRCGRSRISNRTAACACSSIRSSARSG